MCRIGTFKPVNNPNKPTTNGPIPLIGVQFLIHLIDFCAEVTIKQRFENQEKDPIEAVYEFVLDPGNTVSAFYAEVDGRKIEGKVKEKEKAKDDYDDAIASG
jgi:hypothetical protein